MNSIIDKIINSKIIWIVLGGTIIVLVSVLLFLNFKNENSSNSPTSPDAGEVSSLSLDLNGEIEIFLYAGEEYIEPGYLAYDNKKNDISSFVEVSGEVNSLKVGEYELVYTLAYGDDILTKIRKIIVIEKENVEVSLQLNGEEIIYLPNGSEYKELGATAYADGVDVSSEVEINSNVDSTKIGEYEVSYEHVNASEKLIRKVIVFDVDAMFSYDDKKTNSDILIEINNKYFKYIVLPNKVVKYDSKINYSISENGTYEFLMYDKNGEVYKKNIEIANIDKTAPNGSCKAVLLDGKTTFTVNSSDQDIKEYNYNNLYKTSNNTYVINKFIRESYVTLVDDVGNQRKLTCQTELKTLPVITPKKGETLKYKAKSDSLVIHITKNSGYYLTRIWAKDPVYQMRKELVSGSSFKRPKVILEQAISKYKLKNKIVFGGNASAPIMVGSYYGGVAKANKVYNLKEPSALLVYNGKVVINDYKDYLANNTIIYYIDGSNQLKYIPNLKKKTASERQKIFTDVINSGVYNTFAFNKILVDNYKAQSVGSDYNALRQGFCQIDSNNFILVTSDTKTWPRQSFANFMQKIGCKTAVNFDGGGSVALFYKPSGTNTIKTLSGNKRSLSSVMYFTELD